MAATQQFQTTLVTPNGAREAIEAAIPSGVSVFLWGPPGIAKSRLTESIATAHGIAFIDFRLSQLEPTDLRGIPFPTRRGGREGVLWSKPYALPEDLDLDFVVSVPDPTDVRVDIDNPKGSNGIHYCTDPRVRLTSLVKGAEARIVDQYETDDDGELLYFNEDGETVAKGKGEPRVLPIYDRLYVGLFSEETGEPVTGKVRVKVTGKVRGILALEEFNSAPQAVAAAAYQFVLDRRQGEYIVPEGIAIVAMGNRETDKGIVFAMATPLCNRFLHLEMRVDFGEWQTWAMNARVHPEVIGYLSAYKDKLFMFDPKTASRGFPTPRSWEFVSRILQTSGDTMSDATTLANIVGCVGEGEGLGFMEHRRHAADLPPADAILDGRITTIDKQLDQAFEYTLTNTLVYNLIDGARAFQKKPRFTELPEYKEWAEKGDRFMDFLMKNFRPEMAIMAVRLALRTHKLPFHMNKQAAFMQFAERYRNHVMA